MGLANLFMKWRKALKSFDIGNFGISWNFEIEQDVLGVNTMSWKQISKDFNTISKTNELE